MSSVKLTKVQTEVIEILIRREYLETSSFIKMLINKKEYTKGYLSISIAELEKYGLIKKICSTRGNIRHKRLFTKESLKEQFGIVFMNNETIEVKKEEKEEKEENRNEK